MSKATRYPPELRERAIRLVREHRDEHASEWAAIQSIAGKLDTSVGVNTIWVIVAGSLVMFMQAGFAFLEIGFSRAKNAGTVVASVGARRDQRWRGRGERHRGRRGGGAAGRDRGGRGRAG